MKRVRSIFEYLLVRLGRLIVPLIPRQGIVCIARMLGSAAFYCDPHLRRVGLANLDLAFADRYSPKKKRTILKESYKSFALTLLDILWFTRWTKPRMKKWIRFDESTRCLYSGRPNVCVTGHFGNWEHYGQAISLDGLKLASVVAPLNNKAVDALLYEMRKHTGQEIFQKQGAIKNLIRHLKQCGSIAILLDQNTKPADGGIFVDYFGLPVPVSQAAATLAIRTHADIHVGYCLPEKKGRYTCYLAPPIHPDDARNSNPKKSILDLTQTITATLQSIIEKHPEAWLWTYKRWKFVAPGRTREDYPFYSKRLDPHDEDKAKLFQEQVGPAS